MWDSVKCFFIQFNKWAWIGFLFAFYDLANAYGLIKHLLPKKWENIPLPSGWGYLICIIVILWASFMAYHNLRKKKMAEFLKYAPEFRRYKTFRIFSDLYNEGEFLKKASTERRQDWDVRVLIQMEEYCTPGFRIHYLNDTGRQRGIAPLQDGEYYDKAVSEIKDYIDNMFEYYTK
jgi:hypothetical protein